MHALTDKPHARDLWVPRRQLTLEQARHRSSIVGILRLAFTAAAAISIGLLVGQLAASSLSRSVGPAETYRADEVVTMINPRFTGRDQSGEAFVITADSAQRWRSNESLVDLVNPTLIDEFGGQVSAPGGLYDQDSQTLELYEDVRVKDAAGYEFTTTNARVFVREGRIEGLEPLSGTGPLGDVRSDTYEISEDGDVIRLQGNVQMTFEPSDDPEPATEDTPEDQAGTEIVEEEGNG
ncbi:MAG: LPS export ABC transporter periplasmic protein LptC [Pseudomonadota bacterium]